MELNEYQKKAMTTCMESSKNFSYMFLNLVGEIGEFASKVAKAIRKEQIDIQDSKLEFYDCDTYWAIEDELKKDVKNWGYLRHMKCFQLEEEHKFLPVKKDTSKFIEKDGVLMKVCLKCEELKPLTEFATNPTSADGYQCLCHKCFYEKYHKNKKRRRK